MVKIKELIGLIALATPFGGHIGYKDYLQLRDMNRLGWDMRNTPTIDYTIKKGDTYQSLQERFFPLEGYEGINEWGQGSELSASLYRSAIREANSWSLFHLGSLEESLVIRVPISPCFYRCHLLPFIPPLM